MRLDLENNIIFPLFTGTIVAIIGLSIEYTFFQSSSKEISNKESVAPKSSEIKKHNPVIDEVKEMPIVEKPKIRLLPDSVRLFNYHWFAKTLGWALLITSIFLAFWTTTLIDSAGCLLMIGLYFLSTALFIILFKFVGLKLKLFSLIYVVLLYENLINWLYGLL